MLFAGYSHRYQRQEEPEEPDEAGGERRPSGVRPAPAGAERQEASDRHGHSEGSGEERHQGGQGEAVTGGGGGVFSPQELNVAGCLREN